MAPPFENRLGRYRHVTFHAAPIDAVAAPVDLLVVGMLEKQGSGHSGDGVNRIDDVLHGTLWRLRAGGIFRGAPGEALTLSTPPPPLRAQALLLIGIGEAPLSRPTLTAPFQIEQAIGQAMRAALCTHARTVACVMEWSGLDLPAPMIAPTARAMMRGALGAIDAMADQPALPLDWTFDIRHGEAEPAARAMAETLRNWGKFG